MEKHKQGLTLIGFAIAFVGAILFSTKAIMVKLAFAQLKVDALSLLTLRMVFSLPFYLIAAFMISNKEGNVRMSGKQWFYLILLGLFGYYLSSLFDFIGLQYISAGLERLILFLYPTFVVLINALVFKQKINRNQQVALLLTYTGIGLAYFGELKVDTSNPNFLWGSFLIFLCAITYSIYIVGSGRIINQIGPAKFTAYAMLSATAGIFIHFLMRGEFEVLHQSRDLWWYGFALAIIATVIPTFMLSAAIKKIGSNNVAIISSIGPVSTIVQAYYFLNEEIFPEQIAGTVLVVIGVLLLSVKRDK
ncbi:DMT family transporter [Pedobacter sp. SYSU D00535]|uniref:DMT family transporter n=1 Tax=Pedobacter sp. SYSU D00535 TaxID=2810308 RepID=UPI001A95E79D|nr:DMT family transporter [Pedobacter sp. SYSU D00535]